MPFGRRMGQGDAHFFAVHGDRADEPWSCHGIADMRHPPLYVALGNC